ncbi:MAG TPA: alpha/beta fold hydrolase [Candidatus Obscuribacterales bacterium]
MHLNKEKIDLIAPALLVYAGERETARQKGSVLFYHGLTSSKDQQEKELTSLAQRGFLAIGIDNVGHGERRYADFDRRFSGQNPDFEKALLEAVTLTAKELPQLIDAYRRADIIRQDKLGLIGVSMGGYIAYAAILADPRIKAAAVILGSPTWSEAPSISPDQQIERFFPTAILSQNAGQDTSVPPQAAREFHRRLAPYYAQAPERQAYIEYPESGHFMRESDWYQCWGRALNWLETYL